MDSPAQWSAAQSKKLRENITKTARDTIKAACSSLLDRLIEDHCQGSIPEVRKARWDDLIHELKFVSLHDLLVKIPKEELDALNEKFRLTNEQRDELLAKIKKD